MRSVVYSAYVDPRQASGVAFYDPAKLRAFVLKHCAVGTLLDVELSVLMPPHERPEEKFYHGVVVRHIRAQLEEFTGEPIAHLDVHELLKLKFNYRLFRDAQGVTHHIATSTAQLPRHKYLAFIQRCIQWGVTDLGIDPDKFSTPVVSLSDEDDNFTDPLPAQKRASGYADAARPGTVESYAGQADCPL